MSLSSMLDVEPGAILKRQAAPGAVDDQGLPLHGLQQVGGVISGRFKALSSQQIENWRTLGVKATYEFLTEDSSIRNGDFLIAVEDSRIFRVTGTGDRVYAKGSIPTYFRHPLTAEGKSVPGTA